MALFEDKKPFSYEVVREGEDVVLNINLEEYPKSPSLEDDGMVMSKACDMLAEVKDATKLIFIQKRNYEYEFPQVSLLAEIARAYSQLARRKEILGYANLLADTSCARWANTWYSTVQDIVSNLLKSDPLGAYVELVRIARDERIVYEKSTDQPFSRCSQKYLRILDFIIDMLDKTKLIALAKPHLAGHKIGDRDVYRRFFAPVVRPDFMFTKLMATFPHDARELETYTVGNDTDVTIFELPDTVQYLYHITPPEFKCYYIYFYIQTRLLYIERPHFVNV